MEASYFGVTLGSFEYFALLLFALIVFTIIMIATEKERQRRHHREMIKHRIAMNAQKDY